MPRAAAASLVGNHARLGENVLDRGEGRLPVEERRGVRAIHGLQGLAECRTSLAPLQDPARSPLELRDVLVGPEWKRA